MNESNVETEIDELLRGDGLNPYERELLSKVKRKFSDYESLIDQASNQLYEHIEQFDKSMRSWNSRVNEYRAQNDYLHKALKVCFVCGAILLLSSIATITYFFLT